MFSKKNGLTLAITLTVGLVVPGSAFATNGYFAHGYSIKEKGLAGAGVALPQDSLAAATNPAGMVMVGQRGDLGASLFSPSPRSYTATGGTGTANGTPCGMACPFDIGGPTGGQSIESEGDFFLIPAFGMNWMLDPDSSIGISVYGNGGMNTRYKGGVAAHNNGLGTQVTTDGTYGDGTAGVDLAQLFIAGTYSRKLSSSSSVGVTPIFAYQKFRASGLSNFGGLSLDATNLTSNDADTSTGYGVKVGIMGEVGSGVTVGASYQSKMSMGEFDKYKGLFAENGGFDIPATGTVGVAFKPNPKSVITVDVQKIWYSDIKSIANPIAGLHDGSCTPGAPATGAKCLGGPDGAGFGWEDMTVVKLGYQWESGPGMTWRAGFSDGDQPIPETETVFNILAPATIEQHVTFGFTKDMGGNNELNFAFMYALENDVKGTNPFTGGAQTVELSMKQYEAAASWGWKF